MNGSIDKGARRYLDAADYADDDTGHFYATAKRKKLVGPGRRADVARVLHRRGRPRKRASTLLSPSPASAFPPTVNPNPPLTEFPADRYPTANTTLRERDNQMDHAYLTVSNDLDADNQDAIQSYVSRALPMFAANGGELVHRVNTTDVLKGTPAQVSPVLRFPSADVIRDVFSSAEYEKIIPLRDRAFPNLTIWISEDFDPAGATD